MSHEMEMEDDLVDLRRKVAIVEEQNQALREQNSRLALALELASSDLFSSPLTHLVVLHRVLYGTIDPELALTHLHHHLRDDADLADLGRPLKYQYKENVEVSHE